MSRCIISKRVKIPKELISKETIESELIVRGKENDVFCNRQPMVMYEETKKHYIVPVIFGLTYIKKHNLEYKDIRLPGDSINVSFIGSLRENQIPVVEKTIGFLKEDCGTIMSIPCGQGKTICSCYISCYLGRKTLVLVHTSILLNQWIERISEFVDRSKIGTIKQDKFDVEGKTHVIASMQTIALRTFDKNAFDSFGLLVVDECHIAGSEILSKSVDKIGCKFRLGLSATPFRKDNFDKVNFHSIGEIGASVQRSSNDQNINVECIHVDYPVEHHTIFRAGGKKTPNLAKMTNEICENDLRNNLVVKSILQKVSENRHIIVTSSRRNHLKILAEKLEESGFNDFGFLMGGLKKDPETEKKQVLLCTFKFVAEGLDISSLSTLIMVNSVVDVIQVVGRILRKHESKKTPVIVDIVDCDSQVILNQGKKRKTYYKKLGADIKIFDKEFNLIKQAKKRKVEVGIDTNLLSYFQSKVKPN